LWNYLGIVLNCQTLQALLTKHM